MKRLIIACVLTAMVAGAATATAGSLISSRDIQDRGIRGRDIARNTIPANRLTPALRRQIARTNTAASQSPGQNGQAGSNGANGGQGPQGAQGPRGNNGAPGLQGNPGQQGIPGPVQSAGSWGIVNRNTLGSPDQSLRSGPANPPNGDGSLNLAVTGSPAISDNAAKEKAAWGNETDFVGDDLDTVTDVGFWFYQTGEDNDRGNPNTPTIQFEVDPNGPATVGGFSTLTFVVDNPAGRNAWTPYVNAATAPANAGGQGWWFSGGTGASTGCTQATPCTFTAAKLAVPDATIFTAMVSKGRDTSWQGAIDGLRINNEIFDFEEYGVIVRAP